MLLTLTGVFDEPSQAQLAIGQIRELGIDEQDIRSHWGTTGLSGAPGLQAAEHRGFFTRMFAADGPDAQTGDIAEAARRGANIVSVHVADEQKAAEVERILEAAGAVDLGRRVQAWRMSGYEAYDPSSPALSVEAITRERQAVAAFEEEVRLGKRTLEPAGTRVLRRTLQTQTDAAASARATPLIHREERVVPQFTPEQLRAFDAGELALEFLETREEAVIDTRTHVIEEVDIGTQVLEHVETVHETLRRTEVDVQRIEAPATDALWPDRPPPPPPRAPH
ncbi:MAG: hypothetical protein AVDCRST_MAG71-2999 [uncultured Lysobacter sp.]|uniref:DUF2382 domain-containing protein n=1 Tax=uncultured Lysobacter sp. TaxID=271060 RepID=A0A6J4M7J5_9GAMM|nr:MAG: hypothetical protein AVDCRST_MAG71-2999 [uncultured Lysobacter sp.]